MELRYFGGVENAEIAAVLGISGRTALRDWRVARGWLCARLQPPAAHGGARQMPGGSGNYMKNKLGTVSALIH